MHSAGFTTRLQARKIGPKSDCLIYKYIYSTQFIHTSKNIPNEENT